MRLNLLPRERRYYDFFERDVANIVAAATVLTELLARPADPSERQHHIKTLEHQGDEITHEIVRTLNRTFVTPFDRDDIYALASGLDDILDYVEQVSETISLYDLQTIPRPGREMGDLLLEAVKQLEAAVHKLESQKDLEVHWIEVHRIENLGDQVGRQALGELFRDPADPIEVMKLKDLYDTLEAALDTAEDVANVIENIVIKNA